MRPSLTDRLRGIINVPAANLSTVPVAAPRLSRTAEILGGQVIERTEGVVVVVERHYAVTRAHGRERIGEIVETLKAGTDALRILHRAWPQRHIASSNAATAETTGDRLLFLDVETTGLAGGAGTQAFLVGFAIVAGDELLVRQFLLPGLEYERALLAEVRACASQQRTLVTFNGRTFDVPLIETRYLFHRLEFPFTGAPHIDMLHPSRRLWKERPSVAAPPLDDDSCRLAVLERHLAGVHRVGDVPGFEIPSRFFRFVRDGNAFPLEAVLEHNRIDLVSLAVVTARAIRLIERGPSATTQPRECLGLGRVYERASLRDHAEACYAQAVDWARRIGREPEVHAEALRRLALCRRRACRMAEAADAWSQLVGLPGCPSTLRREAREALAIYHEHRSRDLRTARMFVLDALAERPLPHWRAAAEHRLKRIDGKLAKQPSRPLIDQF